MSSSLPLSPAAEEQAALWAARLDGSTLTAADRNALDAWLAENSAHRALLSSYCQFSADLEQQLPALVAAGAVTVPVPKKAARPNPAWLGWFAFAAALIVSGLWFVQSRNHFDTVAPAIAQRQSITLVDGTKVELNARTSLQVLMTSSQRRVRLSDGEAFFTVSKDKSRPFTVETPTGSVRVTGTVFNVRAETAAALDVTVVEGSVQVRPEKLGASISAEPVSLVAGDHLIATPTGVSRRSLSADDLEDELAWRQGRIVLKGTPMGEVLARFAHYHGRTIAATNAAAIKRIGGTFRLDDLDGFLTDIQGDTMIQARVKAGPNGIIEVSLSNEP